MVPQGNAQWLGSQDAHPTQSCSFRNWAPTPASLSAISSPSDKSVFPFFPTCRPSSSSFDIISDTLPGSTSQLTLFQVFPSVTEEGPCCSKCIPGSGLLQCVPKCIILYWFLFITFAELPLKQKTDKFFAVITKDTFELTYTHVPLLQLHRASFK